jgi:hypothetical protein
MNIIANDLQILNTHKLLYRVVDLFNGRLKMLYHICNLLNNRSPWHHLHPFEESRKACLCCDIPINTNIELVEMRKCVFSLALEWFSIIIVNFEDPTVTIFGDDPARK